MLAIKTEMKFNPRLVALPGGALRLKIVGSQDR